MSCLQEEKIRLNEEPAATVTASDDAAEGARAASERRPARWSGR